tara:strand:+ start:2510 stop:4210 length:1701 start_codon:yes stop_codon:yes gene_type:complete
MYMAECSTGKALCAAIRSPGTALDRLDSRLVPICGEWMPRAVSPHSQCHVLTRAADVFTAAFRANFDPFWLHALGKRFRLQRLDPAQHGAIHGMSSALSLCKSIHLDLLLAAQRVALQSPDAGSMTLQEAAQRLGISELATESVAMSRHATSTVSSACDYSPLHLAQLLVFARMAWICQQVQIVQLGERTTKYHRKALQRRLGYDSYDDIPEHLRCISMCCECRRVCNVLGTAVRVAHSSSAAPPRGHTSTSSVMHDIKQSDKQKGKRASKNSKHGSMELGMVSVTTGSSTDRTIRCSKRSSAAFRNASASQQLATARSLDCDTASEKHDSHCDEVAQTVHNGSLAARLRRDAKHALEQRCSTSMCGQHAVLTVPLVGRAVCYEGNWYTFCSFCGVHMLAHRSRLMEAEPCCMNCDPEMSGVSSSVDDPQAQSCTPVQCRFCERVQSSKSSGFHCVTSPHDTFGVNAHLRGPLRKTYWCSLHYRSWLPTAMQTMTTGTVLAHIMERARPLAAAFELHEGSAQTGRAAASRKRKHTPQRTQKSKLRQQMGVLQRSMPAAKKANTSCL